MSFKLWRQRHSELDDEVRAHMEMAVRERVERGEDPARAREAARREFGNAELVRETTRDAWGLRWLENFGQDVRFGVRMLRKNPGFTFVAVLTLALGIGANTAIFSVVETVLLRPLPFKDPAGLVDVWGNNPKQGRWQGQVSYPEFLDWKKQSSVFESMAVYRETSNATLSSVANPVRLHAAVVSPDFFSVLGVSPLMGRGFGSEQEVPGQANVVVLSSELWRKQFLADPNIVGSSATIAGKSYTIIGVMPDGFQFPILAEPIELWIPLAAYDGSMPTARGDAIYSAFARLEAGVSLERATAQINSVENRLAVQYPDNHTPGDGANVAAMLPDLVGGTRDALLILFAAVAVVLLIACANVANLMIVRATGRSREFDIRRALGASRIQLVRQLLTESLLLALVGGVLGLLLGYWMVQALVIVGPKDVPRLASVHLDTRVFIFTAAITGLTSLLFGLLPGLRVSRTELCETLKERAPVAGVNRHNLRDVLVVSEIALSLVMIAAAGLLVRSLWRLQHVNAGFDPAQVLTFRLDLPSKYKDPQTATFYRDLLVNLRGVPGARQVSAAFPLPLSGNEIDTGFDIEGRPADPASPTNANLSVVSPGYFHTMQIAVLRGRDFEEGDGLNGNSVAIVNEAFANRYLAGGDALGKRIRSNAETSGTPAQMSRIVGIVADTKVSSLREQPQPMVFLPVPEFPISALSVVIRSTQTPAALLPAVRERVSTIEPAALVFGGQTIDQYLSTALGQPRFSALLMAVFGALAIVLATVGLYGTVAHTVSQRTNEFGIRVALGATPSSVLRLVFARGMRLAFAGCVIGIAGALALTRAVKTLLFEVGATDPLTFISVMALMTLVTALACYIPARRAMRVDPMVALRYE